ncbi:MAG: hypothetical protein ACRC62_12995 [Microcoleus sp.]
MTSVVTLSAIDNFPRLSATVRRDREINCLLVNNIARIAGTSVGNSIAQPSLQSAGITEKAEGRRQKAEGRGKKAEGRGKREEGRGKREEGRGKNLQTVSDFAIGILGLIKWNYLHLFSTIMYVQASCQLDADY